MNSYRYCDLQVFAMVAGVGEALVEMSTFYHSDYHVPVVKTQQPVGGLVLVALFLILLIVLKPLLFDPLLQLFEEREKRIEGAKLTARRIDEESATATPPMTPSGLMTISTWTVPLSPRRRAASG